MLKVGVLLGDNIGLEVVPEAVKVMKAAAAKTGLQLDWRPLPIGRKSHEASGHTMPPSTVDTVATLDGWLMGPIGHSLYPRNDPTWAKPDFRKGFDLFASVKPVKSYANIESLHKGVDIVFLREVTEGLQYSGVVVAGDGEFRPNDDISIGMRVVTRKCANRVARAALVGGLGLAPGLCVGERQAMAQAAHGSAGHRGPGHRQSVCDDYVGQDVARMARPQTQRGQSRERGGVDRGGDG